MKIIPALDIMDGKCTRLTQGDYNRKTIYNNDPLEVAKTFEDHGLEYLHLVDLDGAKAKHIVNYKVLEKIANQTSLKIDFGGGLKTKEDVDLAFNAGARQVTIGSIAATNVDLFLSWLESYGADQIILGADCKNQMIATQGWRELTSQDVISFIQRYERAGIKSVICTDIDKDGMLQGCSIDLYTLILSQTTVELIASGGISTMEDVDQARIAGCGGVIIGKAIYENKISLKELSTLC